MHSFIRDLSNLRKENENRHDNRGQSVGSVYGVITDVEDPLEKARVRVILDGQEEYQSDWLPVKPSFKGKQPKSLVGQRVEISFADGDITRGCVSQVIDDDSNTEPIMTGIGMRLPFYESGSLPPASEENRGLIAIEGGGPCGSDWLVVCLSRRGSYMWVRHCDLAHIHNSQDRGIQGADSGGDGQPPVDEYVVHDNVAPTTHSKYSEQSYSPPSDIGWYGSA